MIKQEFLDILQRIRKPKDISIYGFNMLQLGHVVDVVNAGNTIPDVEMANEIHMILVAKRSFDDKRKRPIDVVALVNPDENTIKGILLGVFKVSFHELCEQLQIDGHHAIKPHNDNGEWGFSPSDHSLIKEIERNM